MRLIDELVELNQNGKLNLLIKNSIISPSVYGWIEIYNAFEVDLKLHGSKMQAMENVSDKFKVDISTIQRVRQKMEKEIN